GERDKEVEFVEVMACPGGCVNGGGQVAPPRSAAAANARRAAKAGAGERDKEVEFVEVMACPGGCVNGGGQVAPPRSSARARRAAEAAAAEGGEGEGKRYVGRVDDEGMPDVQGEVVEAELKVVADLDGSSAGAGEADRVLSAKEWVAEVERRYWSGGAPASDDDAEGGVDDEAGELATLHPSIRPYVANLPSAADDRALAAVLDVLLAGAGPGAADGRDERRKELLRTSYRAVQTDEVNGLAVVW
ncbi:hypothetical protein JCM3770_001980, partial [Rhodotorula araucariae]